jgi:SAM-dependent methyltransferase
VIHDPDAKTQPGDQPGPASTRITRCSQALTRTGSVRRSRPLSLTEVLTPLAHHHHHCTKYPGVRPRLASRVGGADGLLYSYPTAVCGVLEMHAIEEDDSLVEVGPFVDVSRAGHILGWKPGLSNVQALLGTYDWYLVHRDDSRGRGSHASRPVDQRALGVLKGELMSDEVWDELFDEIYSTTYAVNLRRFDSAAEATAAAKLADVEPPAEILDAPGGFGRHSIPLAGAGFRVTSVDRSAVQQDEGRRRAAGAEWPRFVQADFRELPFAGESFDAVLCLFSSIGYRGEEGDRQTLGEFLRVLRPGATLVVETMHRDRLMVVFQERGWDHLEADAVLLEERRFDHLAGEVETKHTLVPADGPRRTVTFRLRIYTATELTRLLEDVGFAEIECFGDLDAGELSRESRLVVRARKPVT